MSKVTQFSPHVYAEWGELISDLSKEKQADIFNAILHYPHIEIDSGVWRFIKSQIDKDYNAFIERCNKNGEISRSYWKQKNNQTKSNDIKRISNETERYPKHKHITETETKTETKTDNTILHSPQSNGFAERLRDIIQKEKRIQVDSKKLKTWAKSIDLLINSDKVDIDRIERALTWYAKNIGGEFVPVVESGSSFRRKFTNIEDAITRASHTTPVKKYDDDEKTSMKNILGEE